MSRHPVTPADESDLRLHLSRQTSRRIGLLNIIDLDLPLAVQRAIVENSAVTLIDVLYEHQLEGIGKLLDGYTYTVGSSAVEMALGDHWRITGRLQPPPEWPAPGRAEPLLVVSGSCSPITAGQIAWAKEHGFAEIALDPAAIGPCLPQALQHLHEGHSLILHTGNTPVASAPAAAVGTSLGRLVRSIADQVHNLRRLVIAGGDTSSYAARALGIEAVEMICPLVPGAPLCRAHAPGSPVDGIEINLKGGQVGAEDYFGKLLEGIK